MNMKKLVVLIFAVTAFTVTSAMAKSELKDASAQVQNTADNVIHIKVSSIKVTILRNSAFSKQDAIVSASLGNDMPSETQRAD